MRRVTSLILIVGICLSITPAHAWPARPYNLCAVTEHRADGAPTTDAIDHLVYCVAHVHNFTTRSSNIACIGDRESSDYAFARNGNNLGFLQESDVPQMYRFFKTGRTYPGGPVYVTPPRSHRKRWFPRGWSPSAAHAAYNARALAILDVYWMKHQGFGRWTTAGRCGV